MVSRLSLMIIWRFGRLVALADGIDSFETLGMGADGRPEVSRRLRNPLVDDYWYDWFYINIILYDIITYY